jgi:thymidine kinase
MMDNDLSLKLIYGSMFSGKTSALLAEYRQLSDRPLGSTILFKPVVDTRYSSNHIVSHDGEREIARSIRSLFELSQYVNGDSAVLIDEIQFFDAVEVDELLKCARSIQVVVAGLDYDYLGKPFEITHKLMSLTTLQQRLHARCSECGREATRTSLIASGVTDRLKVGGREIYQPRCLDHFTIPRK